MYVCIYVHICIHTHAIHTAVTSRTFAESNANTCLLVSTCPSLPRERSVASCVAMAMIEFLNSQLLLNLPVQNDYRACLGEIPLYCPMSAPSHLAQPRQKVSKAISTINLCRKFGSERTFEKFYLPRRLPTT